MKQEAPQQRRSRTGIPAIHGGEHVKTVDSVRDDERVVRLTEREALANVRAVLELCAAGELRCSDKTSRPTAATIRTIDAHLVHGDFYAERTDRHRRLAAAGPSRRPGQTGRHATAAVRERPCRTGQTTRRGHPPAVAALAHPRGDRRVQPDRADQGPARPQCAHRGQAAPPDGRRGAGRLPARRVDRLERLVHGDAPRRPQPDHRAQREGAVEAVPGRFVLRQPRLRRPSRLDAARRPLHLGGAVRVCRHAGADRPRLRPPQGRA